MIIEDFSNNRSTKRVEKTYDLVVVGGGMAGVCAAIAAARRQLSVALIQDRPVLGGNASSEIRVWMLGATSHMGNNNRWAREGGVVDEIMVENVYKNKEGNPVIFDTILIDKVLAEKNIDLYLNTIVYALRKKDTHTIATVTAYNPQNETEYEISGRLFCDSSGDGLIGYLAGAPYRIGAEDAGEFDEAFAPDKEEFGERLGHTLFFYTKKADKPVKFVAPDFACKRETVEREIHRIQNPNYFDPASMGCKYWWIEYGGRLNGINDTEEIKHKLWSVAYGIWDYIKNSGKFPEAEHLTLEWVGTIPGKRESRRFVGSYMLSQKDIVEQRFHYDAVTFGGWSIDVHPADGVFSSHPACSQWHSKGVYQIPYRCYVPLGVNNLFVAGRTISATHVAFASSRVMATCGAGGEVVGTAAALCLLHHCSPAYWIHPDNVRLLQAELIRAGNYIPGLELPVMENMLHSAASLAVSSELQLEEIPFSGGFMRKLEHSSAQMIPVRKNTKLAVCVEVVAGRETMLTAELRISSKYFNHTPDVILETVCREVKLGKTFIDFSFSVAIPHDCYAFVCFLKNEDLKLRFSPFRMSGLLSVFNKVMPAVSNWGRQIPPPHIGIEEFEFWCPERRPDGQNIAMKISPPIDLFGKENLYGWVNRPVESPHAWVASPSDEHPRLILTWSWKAIVREITLFCDTDFDHPMESVQWGHCDDKMPFCVDAVKVYGADDRLLAEVTQNYRTRIVISLPEPVETETLMLELSNSTPGIPVSLFGLSIQ